MFMAEKLIYILGNQYNFIFIPFFTKEPNDRRKNPNYWVSINGKTSCTLFYI